MAAYANETLNGYAIPGKHMELFEALCEQWHIKYRVLVSLKNLVTVDMKVMDYLRVITEILRRP